MSGPVPVRDAATVMLVRDTGAPAPGGSHLEVFMMRRNLRSDFVGGAYVFPGGAVDDADRHTDLEPLCAGRTDARCSALLGLDPPVGGLAYWVAAVRESFEEAGVLLAYDHDGRIIDLHDPGVAARFAGHRRAVDRGERRLVDVCAEERLQLAADGMHYVSHWITPEGGPRRYDTRFFVARAPERQEYLHDDRETIASCWVRPADALDRFDAGEFEMILPTIRNLEEIGAYDDSQSLLDAAASVEAVPTVQPRVVPDGDGARIVLPGVPPGARGTAVPVATPRPGRPGGPDLE